MELHKDSNDEVVPCRVSCDGTWQRRGYSSLNGCVTTISVDTRKCIDVEVLSKDVVDCKRIEKEKDENTKAIHQAEHVGKCKANFQGSAPPMETEGVACIFARRQELHSLIYTEFLGDGDSKAYLRVENIYDDVHVEKKECRTCPEESGYCLMGIEKGKQRPWREREVDRCHDRQTPELLWHCHQK